MPPVLERGDRGHLPHPVVPGPGVALEPTERFTQHPPHGDDTLVLDYADHRAVNGVIEPYSIVVTLNRERYQIRIEEVLHNPQLAPAEFDFP